MKLKSLSELEFMAKRADEYCDRYDIDEDVYQELLKEHQDYWNFMQENPDCYGEKVIWDQAGVHNRYICFVLMLRISDFIEARFYKSS